MRKQFLLFFAVVCVAISSCNSANQKNGSPQDKLVFRFELDSSGNIKSEEVKQKLVSLAKDLSRNADRVMLNAYSEETGDAEKNRQIASDMADAAKLLMVKTEERSYYNVGVSVKGYESPVNPAKPADIQNRRIEFVYVK